MTEYRLFINRRATDITVEPDRQWPGMWRVRQQLGPHGCRLSDMVNLTRAKDAAIAWWRQEQPGGRGLGPNEVARWEARERTREPRPCA